MVNAAWRNPSGAKANKNKCVQNAPAYSHLGSDLPAHNVKFFKLLMN